MGFDNVLGQDRAKEILQLALAQNRLGHAYLFTGPAGVGKTLLARETAQAVLCRSPGARQCGACRDCLLFAHDGHPDFMLLQPEGTSRVIKISQVREYLIPTLSLMPVQSERRVAIIRDADALQEEAANAILKTLEEPVGATLFILVTGAPSALLPTILSRCQMVRFDPLGEGPLREFNGITPSRFIRIPRKEVLIRAPARLRGLLLPLRSLRKMAAINRTKHKASPWFQKQDRREGTIRVIPK